MTTSGCSGKIWFWLEKYGQMLAGVLSSTNTFTQVWRSFGNHEAKERPWALFSDQNVFLPKHEFPKERPPVIIFSCIMWPLKVPVKASLLKVGFSPKNRCVIKSVLLIKAYHPVSHGQIT